VSVAVARSETYPGFRGFFRIATHALFDLVNRGSARPHIAGPRRQPTGVLLRIGPQFVRRIASCLLNGSALVVGCAEPSSWCTSSPSADGSGWTWSWPSPRAGGEPGDRAHSCQPGDDQRRARDRAQLVVFAYQSRHRRLSRRSPPRSGATELRVVQLRVPRGDIRRLLYRIVMFEPGSTCGHRHTLPMRGVRSISDRSQLTPRFVATDR
jgi:hypothetical protein